jgi:hypothetical protein
MLTNQRDRILRPLLVAAIAAPLAIAAPACGDSSGLTTRYRVSGKVTYKGEPVKKAVINFVPVSGDGRGAAGQVEEGSYALTTQEPGDGAFPGKYKVTVDNREPDEAKMKSQAEALARKTGMRPGVIPQEFRAAAMKNAKGTLPGKYQLAATSDLEVEVKPESNTLNIELKD